MANNALMARLGVTGALYVGAVGVTAPSRTAIAAWPTGMTDLGYISDDGITEALDEDTEEFTPWQEVAPIRIETTSSKVTFQATLWESNFPQLSLYYRVGAEEMEQEGEGDEAVVSFVTGGKPKRDLRSLGIDVVDGVYHRRIFLPLAEITERGDISYKTDEIIAYECTWTAYPGPDGYSALRIFKEGWELPEPVSP